MAFDGIPDDDIWNIDFAELEFTKEIARGSFGKVYKGTYLGVDVAIKQILRHNDPAYMKYIEREISVLKGVRHPFIVGFSGVCLHDTGLYIVTEYVDGGDVRNLLKGGNVPWSRRIQVASDLAKAMFYLHSKKIIHRDLKAKNLLIGTDGRLRLCDFGFARLSEFRIKRGMTICGTPGFVAPEIMMGDDYYEACDVFSYGNVLAELITLARPGKDFWIRTPDNKFQLNFDELKQIAPRECPDKFLTLCLQCCAYNPPDRPDFAYITKLMKELDTGLPAESPRASNRVSSTFQLPEPPTRRLTQIDVAPASEQASILHNISMTRMKLSSGDERISEKHLKKMITRAINPDIFDSEYLQDVLLTYPCFTSPQDVLNTIIERFTSAALESFSPNLNGEQSLKKQQLMGIRIIVFLNTWIEKYPDDFSEEGMSELILAFDTLAASADAMKEPFSIAQSLEKGRVKNVPSGPPILPRGEGKPLDPNQVLNPSLLATDLARQITLIDFSLYRQIKEREYLKESWKTLAFSNIRNMQQHRDELTRWAATCIVKLDTVESRANMISKFIDVAQQCLNLRNFSGFFAVMKAVMHPSVERLSHSWKLVKPHVLQTLKSFQVICSKEEHYKNYKAKQEASMPPCIPFLEVHLEEISYIDSYNPDIGKGGIINFTKHRKIARLIRSVDQYKTSSYTDLITNEAIQSLLLNTTPFDEDNLQKRSLNCERPASFG